MALIEIEDLTVKYPGRKLPILQNVNIHLNQGETILLLGASGSGKSTLGLTLNGLIPHELGSILSGQVQVDNLNTQQTTVANLAQRVGIVFQDPDAQFATLTVEDEIVFGLENLCLPRSEMNGRIEKVLKQVGLPDHRYRRVDQLSGGEKQRIALASLLAMEPTILIFDEPTANLDPVGTQDVFALIRKCKEQASHTIVLIEHKLDDLMDLVDRVIVLGTGGSILADGTPHAVFRDAITVLQQHGVWIPQVSLLAHRLREQGLQFDPFPITPVEAETTLRRMGTSVGGQILTAPPIYRPPVTKENDSGLMNQPCGQNLPAYNLLTFFRQNSTSQPAIEIRHLTYRIGQRTILDDVSLSVPRGDFLAVVGANGAGKTTIVQHLVDILHPAPATVLLQGKDVTRIAARDLANQFDHYEELLDLDFTALREGNPTYDAHMTSEPLYLVCTNGKQDRCCAKFGMPIYKEAARLVGEQVWHSTHIGVDQYAANMLCMPHGVYYSRVTVPEVATIIETDRRGEIYLAKTRGRTRYLPAAQIAEHYLRQQTRNTQLEAFRLLNIHNEAANTDTVRLQSIADGTIHTFTIQHEYREATSAPPSSCSSNVARNYRYEVQLLSYSQDDAKAAISRS